MQKPVAVTGATGFVGGHLLAALLACDRPVRVLVRDAKRLDPGIDQHSAKVEIIEGDLENKTALEQLTTGAGVVIHCAGAIAALDQGGFFKVNQAGAQNVAQAAVNAGVERFILVSSLAAREPQLSDYAASKRAGEDSVAALVDSDKLIIVRPPAVYGPGDRATLPLIKALTQSRAILPGRADQKISLIFVKDLAALLVQLVDSKAPVGAVLEVDDGHADGYRFKDIVDLAAKAQGRQTRLTLLPRVVVAIAGVAALAVSRLMSKPAVLSPAKVRELYHLDWVAKGAQIAGWQPQIQFEEGFSLTLDWYQQNGWLPGAKMTAKSHDIINNREPEK